ncbi:hypothetical protein D3C75_936790 [compost metagenome]
MYAAMAAMPMLMTVAILTPAMISGTAIGSSTLRNRCPVDMPIPIAASRNAGSMLEIAVVVFRMMGNWE